MAGAESAPQFQVGHIALKVAAALVAHPLEYVKFLVQIGHEPIAPKPTRTLFGKPALALPNLFRYAGHIRQVDGFTGIYRGIVPKMCGNLVSNIVFTNVMEMLSDEPTQRLAVPSEENEDETEDEEDQAIEVLMASYFRNTCRLIASRCTAIVITQPFQVIAYRSMAQFVGRETKYSNMFSSLTEIYNQDGISGFFSGIIPRLIGEILTILISSSVSLIITNYFITDKEIKMYTSSGMAFIASTLTYPFHLVSNIMTINNSGLLAGSYPRTLIYSDWTDCWSHLSSMGQLKRGSSLLWRYYNGPTLLRADGTLGPAMPIAFKSPTFPFNED